MGLLAVMGPSRKLHMGLPAFIFRRLLNVSSSRQNASTSCSSFTKSTCGSTFGNIATPFFIELGQAVTLAREGLSVKGLAAPEAPRLLVIGDGNNSVTG